MGLGGRDLWCPETFIWHFILFAPHTLRYRLRFIFFFLHFFFFFKLAHKRFTATKYYVCAHDLWSPRTIVRNIVLCHFEFRPSERVELNDVSPKRTYNVLRTCCHVYAVRFFRNGNGIGTRTGRRFSIGRKINHRPGAKKFALTSLFCKWTKIETKNRTYRPAGCEHARSGVVRPVNDHERTDSRGWPTAFRTVRAELLF